MKEIVTAKYGYNERGDTNLIRYWYQRWYKDSEKNVLISAKEIAKREAEKENKND